MPYPQNNPPNLSNFQSVHILQKLPICYHYILTEASSKDMPEHSFLHSESDLYQDLSSFIQIFKRSITTAELIALTIEKGNPLTVCLRSALEIIEDITQLSSRYTQSHTPQIEGITFSRFIYRLIEIIANCKIKYQYTSSTPHDEALQRFLKEVEAVVRSARETQTKNSFTSIIKLTKMVLLKYCNKVTSSMDQQGKLEEDDLGCAEVKNKISDEYRKIKQSQKMSAPRVFFLITHAETEKTQQNAVAPQRAIKLLTNQYMYTLQRTFSDLRKKFDKYVGMDLDFSFFRTSYFQAKGNYDSFYKDYLARNQTCLSILESYSQEFQIYTKRKEIRTLRKDREKINMGTRQTYKAIMENDRSMRMADFDKSTPLQKDMDRTPISISVSSNNMKNTQISLRNTRKERQTRESPVHNSLSNKYFHPNHQFLPAGLTHKNLANLGQENTNQESHKSFMRIRTQIDKQKIRRQHHPLSQQTPHHNSTIREPIVRGFLTNTGKVSLKMKYFQMKCLPASIQETMVKNRMMLSHKFCIKHANASKSHNWFDRKVER